MKKLSIKQQDELIAVCATDPVTCKKQFADALDLYYDQRAPIDGLGHQPDWRLALNDAYGSKLPAGMETVFQIMMMHNLEAQKALNEHDFALYLSKTIGVSPDTAKAMAAIAAAVGSGKGKGKPIAGGGKGAGNTTQSGNTVSEWKNSVTQSRVNLRNGDGSTGSGLEYAWKKHGGEWGANKSHFTISKDELKTLLQSETIVKSPVEYSKTTGNYIRTVTIPNKNIGIDAKNGGKPTSVITVITDKKGNLVNTFPGKTKVN